MAKLSRSPRNPTVKVPHGTNYLNINGNGWTAQQVDDALIDLVNGAATNGTAIITGNDTPSLVGMAAATTLLSRSWVITSTCAILTADTTFTVNSDGTWKAFVEASGAGTTYQWEWENENGGDSDLEYFVGATSATFNNPAIQYDDRAYMVVRCSVRRNSIEVLSSRLELDLPFFLVLPQGATVTAGDAVNLTAKVLMKNRAAYAGDTSTVFGLEGRWAKDGTPVMAWAAFASEETVTYSIPTSVEGDAGDYVFQVRVTYANQSNKLLTQSAAATLVVNP